MQLFRSNPLKFARLNTAVTFSSFNKGKSVLPTINDKQILNSEVSVQNENNFKYPMIAGAGSLGCLLGKSKLAVFSQSVTGASGIVVSSTFASALQTVPPLAAQVLFLSGFQACKEIKDSKSVGDKSPATFVSMIANCGVWIMYGLMASNMVIVVPNVPGLIFGLYFTSVYQKYYQGSMAKEYSICGGILGGCLAACLILPSSTAATVVGLTGCTMAVALMASPLATLGKVIQTKDTSSMPFSTSVASFINGGSWATYGYLLPCDPMVYVPNFIGFCAASVQLGLFARYGKGKPQETTTEEIKLSENK